ncbi:phage tail tube protein [Sphingomonas sp. PB4P5]|uniref:phage tail tube protein n=1 Tax=Parasphingomonas puruogangriensis TaxID=3096155 RepID=UPI002FC910E4
MSVPNEFDFGILKLGTDAEPPVFTQICGITAVNINQTAQTNDRFRRDCAKMNAPATRRVKVTGTQWDVTASGLSNADEVVRLNAALAKHRVFQIDVIQDDQSDAGEVIGTFEGRGVLTASNYALDSEGDSTYELTIAGEDTLVYTAAV